MTKLFIFDLDGTLANLDHRLQFVKVKPKDWGKFFKNCENDTPVQWVIDLLHMCRQHGTILILSGRSAETEGMTREWLRKHQILYDYIVLRPEKDYRPDEIVKKEMLDEFLRDKDFQVQFIVDDRQRVVDMWRANGYKVLQCNAWVES